MFAQFLLCSTIFVRIATTFRAFEFFSLLSTVLASVQQPIFVNLWSAQQ